MIKIISLIIFGSFINADLWAQNKVLVIEDFSAKKVITFTSDHSDITREYLKKGFGLEILDNTKVDSALILNAAGVWFVPPVNSTLTIGKIVYYDVLDPAINDADSTVQIKIFKDHHELIVTVKVTGSKKDKTGACDFLIKTSKEDTCSVPPPNRSNKFNLVEYDYDKNDVIYLYDFNNLTPKRRFYKISFERDWFLGKRKFDIRKLNLSTERLSPSKQVYIKVVNVNRFRFDVKVDDSSVIHNSEPSALFNRMFLGDTSSLLGTLMSNFSQKTIGSQAFTSSETKDIINDIGCFNSMYSELRSEMINAYKTCNYFQCCNPIAFKEIISQLNKINSGIAIVQLKSVGKKKDLEALNKIKLDCDKKFSDAKILKDSIEILSKLPNRTDDSVSILAGKKKALNDIKLCKLSDTTKTGASIESLTNDLSEITGLVDIQSHLPRVEDLNVIAIFVMDIVEHNQNFTKGPIQPLGTRLDFTIHINSIDSVAKRFGFPAERDSDHYEIPVLKTAFISFSSGSFIGLSSRLKNTTYDWQSVPNSSNTVQDSNRYILAQSGYTNPPMGFAAFANVEWKLQKNFGVGISGGVGLTIESVPKLTYLGGCSLFFGDLKQFAVTGGFAAMQADRLNNNWQTVADNNIVYSKKQTLGYFKEFKLGGFIALTYTPFKTLKR